MWWWVGGSVGGSVGGCGFVCVEGCWWWWWWSWWGGGWVGGWVGVCGGRGEGVTKYGKCSHFNKIIWFSPKVIKFPDKYQIISVTRKNVRFSGTDQ